ncbi:MAG: threonine ammonia-lyase [Candidatus Tectomicrobia bacterium]|nr:threonine ammonia-lyase [Candidatus Tectomicrobia bacterium]
MQPLPHPELDFAAIERAAALLGGVVRTTPLVHAPHTSSLLRRDIRFKLENLQETGSFKLRGAYVKLHGLSAAERRRGVVAASAGNHAQGVAWSARALGIPCTIVMPRTCPLSKLEATRRLGARIILEGTVFDEALALAGKLEAASGAVFIPAFDDPLIMAGQGTVALEVVEAWPQVETLVVPVGGGGLIGGVALAAKTLRPEVRVIGVQAQQFPSMHAALRAGAPLEVPAAQTIADGLAVRTAGRLTFGLARRFVDDLLLVSEEEIAAAILTLLENEKLVVEGAGAVGQAALLYHQERIPGERIAVILSGGNIDVTLLERIIEKGLMKTGRLLRLTIDLPDVPGELGRLSQFLGELDANIVQIAHDRQSKRLPLGVAEVEMTLETRGPDHLEEIMRRLHEQGWRSAQVED